MPIDPACSADYLRKRFDEAVWESGFAGVLTQLPEAVADQMVRNLVDRLIIECGAE